MLLSHLFLIIVHIIMLTFICVAIYFSIAIPFIVMYYVCLRLYNIFVCTHVLV